MLLAWAFDRDGRRIHVGALDPQRRRERAPFACIGCGEPLVARLGAVRAHHFAHPPGSTCALTHPESALHLNAKARLVDLCSDAFTGQYEVRLDARCPGCRRPAPLDLARQGDAAAAEAVTGTLRPDVLVTRAGQPSLALEVKVSHAVDAQKEAALARLSLPTLEIDAREPWEAPIPGGGVAIRVARSMGIPRCPACASAARADADRARGGEAAALAELEAYRARGLMGPRPARLCDKAPQLTPRDRARLSQTFLCPECGQRTLRFGQAIARHACPSGAGSTSGQTPAAAHGARPVAWRGYDGALIELAWWKKE